MYKNLNRYLGRNAEMKIYAKQVLGENTVRNPFAIFLKYHCWNMKEAFFK